MVGGVLSLLWVICWLLALVLFLRGMYALIQIAQRLERIARALEGRLPAGDRLSDTRTT